MKPSNTGMNVRVSTWQKPVAMIAPSAAGACVAAMAPMRNRRNSANSWMRKHGCCLRLKKYCSACSRSPSNQSAPCLRA